MQTIVDITRKSRLGLCGMPVPNTAKWNVELDITTNKNTLRLTGDSHVVLELLKEAIAIVEDMGEAMFEFNTEAKSIVTDCSELTH